MQSQINTSRLDDNESSVFRAIFFQHDKSWNDRLDEAAAFAMQILSARARHRDLVNYVLENGLLPVDSFAVAASDRRIQFDIPLDTMETILTPQSIVFGKSGLAKGKHSLLPSSPKVSGLYSLTPNALKSKK